MRYKEITLAEVKAFLDDAYPNKFVEVIGSAATKEYVFDFAINHDVVVRVFSSIHKDTAVARQKGADAIRVCAVNLTQNRGWISTTRVFRVEGWTNNLHRAINKTIANPETNNQMRFNFIRADMDASHEDTYGWNYVSDDSKYILLIIND